MPPKDEAPADDTIDDPPRDDMMPVLRALVAPAPEVPPAVFMTVDALSRFEAPLTEATRFQHTASKHRIGARPSKQFRR